MSRIKYLDLFAGIGGFRTGLTNAGNIFLPVGWCEIDRYAQKAYRALYETGKENTFDDDATKIEPAELPDIASSSAQVFLASRFLSAEEDLALLIREALSFMKSSDWLKPSDLLIFSLKTCRGYSITPRGKLSERSLPRFMSWGTVWNGVCLTAPITVSHSKGGECILSDILISDCPAKYFLSPKSMEKLLGRSFHHNKLLLHF